MKKIYTLVIEDASATPDKWSDACIAVRNAIAKPGVEILFFGGPTVWDRKRNLATVFECEPLEGMGIQAAVRAFSTPSTTIQFIAGQQWKPPKE